MGTCVYARITTIQSYKYYMMSLGTRHFDVAECALCTHHNIISTTNITQRRALTHELQCKNTEFSYERDTLHVYERRKSQYERVSDIVATTTNSFASKFRGNTVYYYFSLTTNNMILFKHKILYYKPAVVCVRTYI